MNKAAGRLPFGFPPDLAVLTLSNFIWGLGEGLFIYFYPLSLQYWALDTVQIGLVLSMIGVIMAVVQVPAGYLSDRFGTRPLIRAAFVLGVASALTMGFAENHIVFVTGMLGMGFTSFVGAPLYSYATQMRGNFSVQRVVTLVSGFYMLGTIVGPAVGGWIGQTAGLPTVFRTSAGLFFLATVLIFFARRPATQDVLESAVPMVSPLANPRFLGLLVVIFLTIFALSMPQQLTSIYLQEVHDLSLQQIGTTGTLAGIGAAVIMFALGNLSAPAGMIVGQLLIGLFSLIMWRGQSAAAFYTGYLFVGGYRLYRSMALAFARQLVKASDIGLAYGLVETGSALAITLAPLAAGFLYNSKPVSVYTVSIAALAFTIAVHALLSQKMRPEAARL